ncbi:MAG: hypothetical protein ACRD5F_01490 [Candidatus Acidiferrales bacterium]
MKITMIIDDAVLADLEREAVRQGKTVSELAESAIRLFLLSESKPESKRRELPTFYSGGHLVDIDDRQALYRVMEEEED